MYLKESIYLQNQTYFIMKEAYKQFNQKEIANWIKKKLRTQDRLSGVKVWLLMRTVLKLLGSTWFDEWCRSIIANTWGNT